MLSNVRDFFCYSENDIKKEVGLLLPNLFK
nr:MAG TPA: hypothetical protein [Caudoviricetes sp.]